MDTAVKKAYTHYIKKQLQPFEEVHKIIIFGSFFHAKNPNDIDVAVVQDSYSNFLTLSLKYRKALRELSKKIPIDIVPIKENFQGAFAQEIENGQVIYEK